MKKMLYKLFVALVFSFFGMLGKLLFTKNDLPIEQLFTDEQFWINFIIFFAIGYVVLGNLLWVGAQKNKQNQN